MRQNVRVSAFVAAALTVAVGLTNVPFARAEAGTSAWVKGNLSQVRLIAGKFDGKSYRAGIEIRLKGKAHTYWRDPGDGGVPPVFDFSKSANVKLAKVHFPAPVRSGKPGEEFIGYERRVVFPVRVTPENAGRKATLDLKLNYAACEKICVPEQARMKLVLVRGQHNASYAALIGTYEAKLPKPLSSPDAPRVEIKAVLAGKRWAFNVLSKTGNIVDLFVEGPEGWYFDRVSRGGGKFGVTLAQKPERPGGPPVVHVTITSTQGAFEGRHKLP